MKKYMLDMKVTENCSLHKNYCLLKLTSDQILPEMLPGQFVQVRVDNSPTTFLRRPISINYVDRATNELWLLVQLVGDGTRRMAEYNRVMLLTSCCLWETVSRCLPIKNKNYC